MPRGTGLSNIVQIAAAQHQITYLVAKDGIRINFRRNFVKVSLLQVKLGRYDVTVSLERDNNGLLHAQV